MVSRSQSPIDQQRNNGSDFDSSLFNREENEFFQNLLPRLRSFEAAVCSQFRQLENEMRIDSERKGEQIRELERMVNEQITVEERSNFDFAERIVKLEDQAEENANTLKGYKQAAKIGLKRIVERIEGELKNVKTTIGQLQEKIETVENDFQNSVDILRARIELLELKEPSIEEIWSENGHGREHEELGNSQQTKNKEDTGHGSQDSTTGEENCEIMMADPFFMSVAPPGVYDGNPNISFSRWIAKFEDMLLLYSQLSEVQKLNRLRISLTGQARATLESMAPSPQTLDEAINFLKSRFENENTKSIARQAMSICKQAPGEKVYEFANRLNEVVRTVLSGENENVIQKRLLEEFLDRLSPDLQFEVKANRPVDYSNAYELAQHFELLLAGRRGSQISVAELSSKVEALAIQQQSSGPMGGYNQQNKRGVCFYCHRPGHLIKDCRKRKYENSQKNGQRNQTYFNRENKRDNRNWGGQWERANGDYNENRNRERENWRTRRSPTPEGRRTWIRENANNRRYENADDYSKRDRSHSPEKRVRFQGGRIPAARIASPILLALIAVLTLFGGTSGTKTSPMICLPDAPTSLWSLPADPICPSWSPTQTPILHELKIFRQNTLKYKTDAVACSCVKTKISRRVGFFGGSNEESKTEQMEIPTSNCKQMRETNHSMAGELNLINGTFMATNNSLEVGWGFWPYNLFWQTSEILNCYVYDTVVFTRHGMEGISTPIGECSNCLYQAGSCRCTKSSLLWDPDIGHQCSYIWMANMEGEYSSEIWLAESGDFALTFKNKTIFKQKECLVIDQLMVSDQSFAVLMSDYESMVEKAQTIGTTNRKKRFDPEVGLVYSSQLSAELTALSLRLTQNTRRIFEETVRKICTNMQILSDQILTLSVANPTLLTRYFLGNPFLVGRLVTENKLEVKPCFAIFTELHFNWQKGVCFSEIPVTFKLDGKTKNGFIDPVTRIIHPFSKEVDCGNYNFLYLNEGDKLIEYNQKTGDIEQIPTESVRQLTRHGRIDFPEISVPIFKNKVLTNFTELYSPENFKETIKSAKIMQEIVRMSQPNVWETFSEHQNELAGGIVANGLFSFLRGGIISANQLWVFLCCCYVTITVLVNLFCPIAMVQLWRLLNVSRVVARVYALTQRQIIRENTEKVEKMESGVKEKPILTVKNRPVNEISRVPLTKRWPSPEEIELNKAVAPNGLSKKNAIQIRRLKEERCAVRTTERQDIGQTRNETVLALTETENWVPNFKKKGRANRHDAVFLVDTGAHITLCSVQTARKLGIKLLHNSEIPGVVGIDGKIVPIMGQTEILIELMGHEVISIISVVDRNIGKGSYDIILGRNTFQKFPFLLDLQSGQLVEKIKKVMVAEEKETKTQILEEMLKEVAIKKENEIDILRKCLKENCEAFSENDYDLGTCKIVAPTILTSTEMPERVRPYPIPEKYESELKAHIGKMLEVGVIKESTTPWVHNIVLVKKTNGQLRPCVDFRPLNKVTIADPYPLPRMDKAIFRAAGKRWYSTLDLASGFWQIPLDAESSYKCGVITPWGLYQMLKLPFGLRNAPSIFQRTMDQILKGVPNVMVYIDDILIYSEKLDEHIESLSNVFSRLRENGLKLKGQKCRFLQNECVYLGHILSASGYQPSLSNREVIENFPPPTNVKEIKRFLGMVSFFRKFIPNFAQIAYPLNKLTRGGSLEFDWGENEEKAMNLLKNHLLKSPSLRAPNYALPFYLFTDASAVAYGGALMQAENGEMFAIGYWSRTLTDVESRLPPTHGELAAIVHAVHNFRPIVYGTELIILTDHRPLTFLFHKASSNPKLNRWLMAIQEFEPKVIYLEGRANKVADALSRVPIAWNSIEAQFKDEIPHLLAIEEAIDREKLERETKNDHLLSRVITKIRESWIDPIEEELLPYYQSRDSLYLEGELIRKRPNGLIVVPKSMQIQILELIHKAHFGIVRSKAKARKHVWWPKITEDIENFVKECVICQRNAASPPRIDPEHRWPESRFPFERAHADLAGPIWGAYFLVLVDAYSKFPFVHQLNSTNSLSIISVFCEIFGIFGSPRLLVTDNGPQFVSAEMEEFLFAEGVIHKTSAPYHPASNGEAERFVRTVKDGLKKLLEAGNNLKRAQFIFLQEYRSSPCPTLDGNSPAQLFLKREMRTGMDRIKMPKMKDTNGSDPQVGDEMRNVQRKGAENRQNSKRNFEPGDAVWAQQAGERNRWGPGVLLEPMGERMWRMELEGGGEKTVHVDQIKERRIAPARH